MMKLALALLAALPLQAVANEEDPIAYKCYYCTESEMEDVALKQGVGRHYVYDVNKSVIVGFAVSAPNGNLIADRFEPEDWAKKQFSSMMSLFEIYTGDMVFRRRAYIYAPGFEHSRIGHYMWGHHLSALHPAHERSREIVQRFLADQPALDFLDTSSSDGKLLRFAYMVDGTRPILAAIDFGSDEYAHLYFDHQARRWEYIQSSEIAYYSRRILEESRDDFAPHDGTFVTNYRNGQSRNVSALKERAESALIPVHGEVPTTGNTDFRCVRVGDDIQCHIERR